MKTSYKAILFDMDGTLLPMELETFTNGYFKELGKKLAHFGISQELLVKSIWAGTKAMYKNDGTVVNHDRFWQVFAEISGITDEKVLADIDRDCLDFYQNEFAEAKKYTGENPKAVEAVTTAGEKAPIVVLSTNPIFPMCAQEMRLSWVGLNKDYFKLITSYETDSFSKPNPAYFLSICERIKCEPSECLLIGNDEFEDGWAATKAGIDCFIVSDCVIKSEEHPWNGECGTFDEMISMLSKLNSNQA